MESFKDIDLALDKLKIDIKNISTSIIEKIEEDLDLRFSHEFLKMEGSSLSFQEVKDLLASIPSKTDKE
ncbi:hypothetical protein [Peptoniphilus genitalis]|uniref:hypothetical protein n=1 Tax=Peptoniphilus genitalis TaxID=3036303 RepID=UPI0024ADE6FB|nr:hypothetical protein [Peptoniphilus sp. Marseille-Q7072]